MQFLKTEITADFTWFYLKESPGVQIMLTPIFSIKNSKRIKVKIIVLGYVFPFVGA